MRFDSDMRLLMAVLAELHRRGFGRLKLWCYVKEGLGAWRYVVFASDTFPERVEAIPSPVAAGSVSSVGMARRTAKTIAKAAESFLRSHYSVARAGRGADSKYQEWYASLQSVRAIEVFEMESPYRASLNERRVPTPYEAPSHYRLVDPEYPGAAARVSAV